MQKLYKSDVSAAIHETAEGLYEHAVIDKATMKEFDESCLTPRGGMGEQESHDGRENDSTSRRATIIPLASELHEN